MPPDRYHRHLILPGFGPEGQEKLRAASVVVVGAGGLGSPVLLYLAAAGVGTLEIVDDDLVEETNLQRQVLYGTASLGRPKVEVAAERLHDLNPDVACRPHRTRLTADNASRLLSRGQVVVDCCDNIAGRLQINDTCLELDRPFVHGAICRFAGQVSVFNYTFADGSKGPTYRCLYPDEPLEAEDPADLGVLGVLPGITGCLMASEVIKLITGVGEPLAGRVLIVDTKTAEIRTVTLARQENPDYS